MKSLLLIPILALGSLPAEARTSQRGYSNQCFEEVYREEYIPGTVSEPGRIRSYVDKRRSSLWSCTHSERDIIQNHQFVAVR